MRRSRRARRPASRHLVFSGRLSAMNARAIWRPSLLGKLDMEAQFGFICQCGSRIIYKNRQIAMCSTTELMSGAYLKSLEEDDEASKLNETEEGRSAVSKPPARLRKSHKLEHRPRFDCECCVILGSRTACSRTNIGNDYRGACTAARSGGKSSGGVSRKLSAESDAFSEGEPVPRSTASLTIAVIGLRRLDPPVEFAGGSLEGRIFVETVMSVPADHFAPEDRALLAECRRAAALAQRASEELAAGAVVGSMPSPWLAVHGSAVRSVALLSTRLRLGPRSRSHYTRKGKPVSAPSYYDLNDRPNGKGLVVVKTRTRLSEVDRDALERALALAKASDEPGRREQRHKDWFEAAASAAYSCQRRALQLKPWQSPPCYGDAHPGRDGHADAAVLLKRLLDNNLSRWEPDPIGALAAIEARAHGELPAA